jgi:hypothetical protein
MTEQQSFIAGIEFAAKYLRDNFPDDIRVDGAAFFALQIQLQANKKKADIEKQRGGV